MIYEYVCPKCSSVYTNERKMTDPEDTPICGPCNQITQRVWSATTAIFNGSGFYSTDNRK